LTEGYLMPKHTSVHCTYRLQRTMGDDVFCASSFPADGCCYPKHVGAVTVRVLTNSCKVSFNYILMYIYCTGDV
jgi:hypothetical protein